MFNLFQCFSHVIFQFIFHSFWTHSSSFGFNSISCSLSNFNFISSCNHVHFTFDSVLSPFHFISEFMWFMCRRFFLQKVGCAVGCGLALFADGTQDFFKIAKDRKLETKARRVWEVLEDIEILKDIERSFLRMFWLNAPGIGFQSVTQKLPEEVFIDDDNRINAVNTTSFMEEICIQRWKVYHDLHRKSHLVVIIRKTRP